VLMKCWFLKALAINRIILTFWEQMSLCKNSIWCLCSRCHFKLRRNSSTIPKSPNSRKSPMSFHTYHYTHSFSSHTSAQEARRRVSNTSRN
jgi:hypothetical protein